MHGIGKSNQKSFKPLRHEGRLGAAISSDRKAYLTGGVHKSISFAGAQSINSGGGNYKSITSFGAGGIPRQIP